MKFGSKELKEKLESKYVKFDLGIVYEVRVNPHFDIVEREIDFTNKDDELEKRIKYDIQIDVNNETKLWSVSKRVLDLINNNIDKTMLFNVIMTKQNYNIIPIINKKEGVVL